MKTIHHARSFILVKPVVLLMGCAAVWASPAFALDGQVQIHDPATITRCDGKFYTYGTGAASLVSDDGWTWRRGVTPGRRGMAPDVIHLGDRYYMYVSANIGGQPRAAVNMISNRTLDPNSPDFEWIEGGVVASSDGTEFCNAIDPGVFLDPTDGRLWMVYGSYFGYIRLVELDPDTGKRIDPDDTPVDIAINCEASTLIYHDGWYYLLATHGSCCRGADSGYNIRVGRARKVTGPFVDHLGVDMLLGGGRLFVGSGGRFIGPGHFGLIDLGDGVQKFSCHYEADLDRGGASVVDIRPLLWRDGWPVAGDNFREGTYEIESVRTGTALELAVEGVPVGGRRRRGMFGGGGGIGGGGGNRIGSAGGGRIGSAGGNGIGGANSGEIPGAGGSGIRGAGGSRVGSAGGAGIGGAGGVGFGGGGRFGGGGGVIEPQDVEEVSANWPAGSVPVRMANYLCQAQQKWTVAPVAGAGGYLGSPYFKITVAGTDRTLAVGPDDELIVLPAFTGGPEQLWRLDQLTDGTWRLMPKSSSDAENPLVLSAVGSSFATLARFDPAGVKQRWLLKTP